ERPKTKRAASAARDQPPVSTPARLLVVGGALVLDRSSLREPADREQQGQARPLQPLRDTHREPPVFLRGQTHSSCHVKGAPALARVPINERSFRQVARGARRDGRGMN